MDITAWAAAVVGVVASLKVVVTALLVVAALTPTDKDDNWLHRAANLLDKALGVLNIFKPKA